MLGAIARLLGITFGVLSLTLLAVVFLRWMGLKQQFQTASHPWFSQTNWNVLAPDLAALCAGANPEGPALLQIPVRRSKWLGPESPRTWEIPCPDGALSLQTFLKQSPQKRFLLDVQAGETTDLDKLVDIVHNFETSGKSFAIYAAGQKVARDLRKQRPEWLFAADSASLLRLHLFSSLWLETATDFWPDFVIASNNAKDGSRLSAREVEELHRRQKRVLWRESAQTPTAPFTVDGVVTAHGEKLQGTPKLLN